MYKVKTGPNSFEVASTDAGIFVNGEPFSWDLVKIEDNCFHIIHNQISYRAYVVDIEEGGKKVVIRINNQRYDVALQDKFDLLLEKLGMNNANTGRVNSIKAPMPGLIIELKVKEGDAVKQNDPLIVLEAMKMENIIKSPGEGVVKAVRVKKGESVEKNQILIEF